jgi:hypothetical protein
MEIPHLSRRELAAEAYALQSALKGTETDAAVTCGVETAEDRSE